MDVLGAVVCDILELRVSVPKELASPSTRRTVYDIAVLKLTDCSSQMTIYFGYVSLLA